MNKPPRMVIRKKPAEGSTNGTGSIESNNNNNTESPMMASDQKKASITKPISPFTVKNKSKPLEEDQPLSQTPNKRFVCWSSKTVDKEEKATSPISYLKHPYGNQSSFKEDGENAKHMFSFLEKESIVMNSSNKLPRIKGSFMNKIDVSKRDSKAEFKLRSHTVEIKTLPPCSKTTISNMQIIEGTYGLSINFKALRSSLIFAPGSTDVSEKQYQAFCMEITQDLKEMRSKPEIKISLDDSEFETKNSDFLRSHKGFDKGKKVLFVDLDETLIHSLRDEVEKKIVMKFRPYLLKWLKEVNKDWNLVLFTAGGKNHADRLLKRVDPQKIYFKAILSNDHCSDSNVGLTKDLRSLETEDFKLKDMLLIDNRIRNLYLQPFNGIPILPFFEEENDKELKYIIPFLNRLSRKDIDIQSEVRERYGYLYK